MYRPHFQQYGGWGASVGIVELSLGDRPYF